MRPPRLPKKGLMAIALGFALCTALICPAHAQLKRELSAGAAVIGKVNLTQGGNDVDVVSEDGLNSARTVPGLDDDGHVSLDTGSVSASTGFVLIDLSDTAGFPHTNTDHVVFTWEKVSISPSTAFRGSVCIGVLTDSGIVSSDIDLLNNFEFTQAAPNNVNVFHEYNGHHFGTETTRYRVDGLEDDQIFTTGGALAKPGAGTAAPAVGDVVLKIDRTAGTVEVTYSLGYRALAD